MSVVQRVGVHDKQNCCEISHYESRIFAGTLGQHSEQENTKQGPATDSKDKV